MRIDAILLDKDGTLFDMQATWAPCAERIVALLAGDDPALGAQAAAALGFDREKRRLCRGSVMVAETPERVVQVLATSLGPRLDRRRIAAVLEAEALATPQVPVAELLPLLEELLLRGLRLACVTNDAEGVARVHLREAGIDTRFHAIIGCDSGHGAKPDPGPFRAAADLLGVEPARALVVGDALHDLDGADAAGMQRIGVLTGTALREDLAPRADDVLESLAALPAWLDTAAKLAGPRH